MAITAAELKAKFSADLVDLEAGFKKAESLQKQFVSQSAGFKVNPVGNAGEVAASFKQMDVSVNAAGEVLSKYKFESVEAATATQKFRAAQLESAQATVSNKNQIMALRSEKHELAQATNQAKLRMLEFKESQLQAKASSGNLLTSLTSLKGLMAGGSFLAVGSFGKEAIDAFSGFEGKLKEIQAVSSVTSDQMKQLSDRALELGEKFPASARDAAGGFAELSKAGFTTNEVLQSSLGLVTLSTAGNLEMGRSAEILAGSIRGFGLAASDANHVVDLLAQTANQSSVDLTDMGESFKYIAPAAQAAGFNIEDVSIALGLMGNSMIKGSEAGTSLRSMITGLTAPTAEGAAALEGLGVKVEGAGGKIKPFREIITELRGSFTTLSQADQIDMAKKIVGKEAMSGFLSVIRASDADFQTMTDSIDHADGAAKRMSDTMSSGLQGKMNNLSGSVESLQIKLGEKLAPGFGKLVDAFNDAIPKITDLTLNVGTFLAEAFKNASEAIGPVASSLEFIGSVADRVNLKVRELGAGTITTNKSVADNLNFGNAIQAQGAKAFEGVDKMKADIVKASFESKDAIDRLNQGIFKTGEEAAPRLILLQKNFQQFKDTAASLKDAGVDAELAKLGQSLDQLRDKVGPINGMLVPAIENLGKVSITNADSIQTRLPAAMNVVASKADDAGKKLSFLTDEMKRLGEAASTSSQEMNDASGKMKVMDDIALKSSPAIQDLWKEYKNYSDKAAEGGVSQDKWNTLAEKAKDKMAALSPKMGDVAKAYEIQKNKLDGATKSFEDNTISLSLNEGNYKDVQAASEKAAAAISKTGDATADAAKMAKSHVADWKDAGFQSVQGFIDAITAGAGRAATAAAGVASQAASATRQKLSIQSPSKVFEEIGQFMMKGWELGIDKNGDAVIGKVASTFSSVMGAVKTGVEAINAVSTFQGMNNNAANQFIFDSGNFITVFGNKAQGFSDKWLEATGKYASALGAGLGVLKGGVEGLNSFKDYGGMSNEVMNQFAQDANNTLIVFSAFATNFDVVALQSTQLYAESLGKVVGTIEPAVKGITSLKDYPGLIEANLTMLVKDSVVVVQKFQAEAGNFQAEALTATGVYAEGVGKIVGSIAGSVSGLSALANAGDLKRVAPAVVAGIVADVKLTAEYMGQASALMSGEVIKKTGDFSDMSKKVTDSLSGSIKFFEDVAKMSDISGTWQVIGALVDDTTDTVLKMAAASTKLDKDGSAGAEKYATTTGKVFDGLKKAIDTAQAASALKGGLSGIMDPFLNDLDLTYAKIAELNIKAGSVLAISLETSGKMMGSTKALSDGFASQQTLKSYLPGTDTGAAPALPAPIPLGAAFGGGSAGGGNFTINGGIHITLPEGTNVNDAQAFEQNFRKVFRKVMDEEGAAYVARQQAAGVRF